MPIRVKGQCPLRVRAEPVNLLPQGNPRRQAEPEPYKASHQACALPPRGGYTAKPSPAHPPQEIKPEQAKRKFCADTGQGTMSLAGAGRSPRNHCRKVIPAVRRKPDSTKQAVRLAPFRRKAVIRRQAESELHKASRQACALSPSGDNSTPALPENKTAAQKTQQRRKKGKNPRRGNFWKFF